MRKEIENNEIVINNEVLNYDIKERKKEIFLIRNEIDETPLVLTTKPLF